MYKTFVQSPLKISPAIVIEIKFDLSFPFLCCLVECAVSDMSCMLIGSV